MRAESGTMQFGDDWCGVFFRGDNAGYYGFQLGMMLEEINQNEKLKNEFDAISLAVLKGLAENLSACRDNETPTNKLKDFKECVQKEFKPSDETDAIMQELKKVAEKAYADSENHDPIIIPNALEGRPLYLGPVTDDPKEDKIKIYEQIEQLRKEISDNQWDDAFSDESTWHHDAQQDRYKKLESLQEKLKEKI